MEKKKSDKIKIELEELISLGERTCTLFKIEMCDHVPEKYKYLDEYPESQWDSDDRLLKVEYDNYLKQVAQIHSELKPLGNLSTAYERFYSKGYRVVSALLPERLDDFESQYKSPKSRKEINFASYTIFDGLRGTQNSYKNMSPAWAISRIQNQIDIIKSIYENIGSALFEIEETLRADLFDSEIDSAKYLATRKHLRAAGAVVGVVLEKHLSIVANRHSFSSRKKNPSISDFNEHLKSKGIIDITVWRRIQGLADIRNLCDHPKDRDPTEEDIDDLIHGVERILKQVH